MNILYIYQPTTLYGNRTSLLSFEVTTRYTATRAKCNSPEHWLRSRGFQIIYWRVLLFIINIGYAIIQSSSKNPEQTKSLIFNLLPIQICLLRLPTAVFSVFTMPLEKDCK